MAPSAVAPSQSMSPSQQNSLATNAILATAVDRVQLVASTTVFPASNPVAIVQPINVGLIKRFIIIVAGTITNSGSQTLSLTQSGLANLFGQGGVQYTDLNNYLRVNTSGKHLTYIANAKRRGPFGGTYSDNAVGTATATNRSKMLNVDPATWPVFSAPATITTGAGSGSFRAAFELPLAYTDRDLRGAIWANVLNAVQQITLTLNAQAVTANPSDDTFAVYSGPAGAAGSITSATITIYQEYLDQLPIAGGRVVLPALSLSTVYELKSTIFSAITPNQEFFMPYANQRSFASTFVDYNNNGTNTGHGLGADVSYWALLAANASYIWKLDPLTVAMKSRDELSDDLPAGSYYFPTRRKNLATLQYGNLQLTLNAITAAAGAYVNFMVEDFALLNTLQSGASLASS